MQLGQPQLGFVNWSPALVERWLQWLFLTLPDVDISAVLSVLVCIIRIQLVIFHQLVNQPESDWPCKCR